MPPQFLGNPQDNLFVSDDWGDEGNFEIIADDDWISLPNVAVIVDRGHLLNDVESDGDHFSDDTGWIETDDDDNDPDYEDHYPEYEDSYPDYEDYDSMETSETLNEDLSVEANSPAFYGIYENDIAGDEILDDDIVYEEDIVDDDDEDYYDYDLVFGPLNETIVTTDNPKTTDPTTETNSNISSTESSSSSISKAESSSNILTIAESNDTTELTIAPSNSNNLIIKEGNTD